MPVSIADGVSAVIPSGGGGSSLPDQSGNVGKYLKTNGTTASWEYHNCNTKANISTLHGTTKAVYTPSTAPGVCAVSGSGAGADRLVLWYHSQNKDKTLSQLMTYCTVAGPSGTKARIGFYLLTNGDFPATLVIDSGDITGLNTTGEKAVSNTSVLESGEYIVGIAVSASCSIRAAQTQAALNLTSDLSGSTNTIPYYTLSSGWTSLPATINASDLSLYSGGNSQHVPFWRY